MAPPGLGKAASADFERLELRWQRGAGSIPEFNDAIRAALVKTLGQRFAARFQSGSASATAEAKRASPNNPALEYAHSTRLMRRFLWTEFNHKAIPPNVTDINDCRVLLNQERDQVVGLIPRKQITPSHVPYLYNPGT
jgi:hypothetical protein